MNKIKINLGLACLILLVSLFVGFETLLLVSILMLLFCECDDSVKINMSKFITFMAGIAIFKLSWTVVSNGVSLGITTINNLIQIFNSYMTRPLDTIKLQAYLLNPIDNILEVLDNFVNYFVLLVKFYFIISIIRNKPLKSNFIFDKVYSYVNSFQNYVNSFNNSQQSYNQNMQQNYSQNNQNFNQGMQQSYNQNTQQNTNNNSGM